MTVHFVNSLIVIALGVVFIMASKEIYDMDNISPTIVIIAGVILIMLGIIGIITLFI